MNRNLERFENVMYPYVFRKSIPAGEVGTVEIPLTARGYVTSCTVNFAAGENGTLHVRPFVMLNGDIPQELIRYAADKFISGDDSTFRADCYQEIENHARLVVAYENVGAAASQLSVDIIVQYDDFITQRNIIG